MSMGKNVHWQCVWTKRMWTECLSAEKLSPNPGMDVLTFFTHGLKHLRYINNLYRNWLSDSTTKGFLSSLSRRASSRGIRGWNRSSWCINTSMSIRAPEKRVYIPTQKLNIKTFFPCMYLLTANPISIFVNILKVLRYNVEQLTVELSKIEFYNVARLQINRRRTSKFG
jgi:hypothetical protein